MSLSLVIASVPVALPMVMKVTLSIGAKEMSDEGGIATLQNWRTATGETRFPKALQEGQPRSGEARNEGDSSRAHENFNQTDIGIFNG